MTEPKIAYFSMEIAVDAGMPTYRSGMPPTPTIISV